MLYHNNLYKKIEMLYTNNILIFLIGILRYNNIYSQGVLLKKVPFFYHPDNHADRKVSITNFSFLPEAGGRLVVSSLLLLYSTRSGRFWGRPVSCCYTFIMLAEDYPNIYSFHVPSART